MEWAAVGGSNDKAKTETTSPQKPKPKFFLFTRTPKIVGQIF